jgi:glycosyltransferase involved in cell wall biosynthesis
MKIFVVSQYFWPEEFRINDFVIELTKRGHEVTVLTGNPNYPKGRFYPGYGFKYSVEFYQGIKIYRVPILPRCKSIFTLVVNYISFVISGSIFALFHKDKYDRIVGVNYSPITAVYPAIVYKMHHKTKLLLWVQDLWPESVRASGTVKSDFIDRVLLAMTKNIYRHCDKIIVSNSGFIESILDKNVQKNKISLMPNWAEDLYEDESYIHPEKYRSLIPEGFIVMFAGNIGEAQDFESILEAAVLTKHIERIKWMILGDGRKKAWLLQEVLKRELSSTFFVLGRYQVEEMPSFFFHSHLVLATLKDEYIFSLTLPAKVQSYMAFGKPIVTMLSGIGNEVVDESNCGFTAKSSDFRKLAENVIKASQMPKEELTNLGLNGKKYYQEHFAKKVIIDRFLDILNEE